MHLLFFMAVLGVLLGVRAEEQIEYGRSKFKANMEAFIIGTIVAILINLK